MPIPLECPHCRKKLRVADKLAGKAVNCPGCQGAITIPLAGQSSEDVERMAGQGQTWYILCEDGEQIGPVSKEQLDNLATMGRLSFCQVRRQDWQRWKWADDIYRELPPSNRGGKTTESKAQSVSQDPACSRP